MLAGLLLCLWNCRFQCQDGYAKPSGLQLSGFSKHSTFSLALERAGLQCCQAISGTFLPAFSQLLIHYENTLKKYHCQTGYNNFEVSPLPIGDERKAWKVATCPE